MRQKGKGTIQRQNPCRQNHLFKILSRLPTRRPWRLGTTSYVYPDDIPHNVERLAGHTEDIELVLFESSDFANLPSPATIRRLDELRLAHGFSFTIHFPIDRQLGSPHAEMRREMLDQILRIVDTVRPLDPFAYILHPEGIAAEADSVRLSTWQSDMAEGVDRIVAHGIAPHLLAVENLAFPFDWCAPFIEAAGLSVCLDVGHLWRGGVDVAAHMRRWLPRTRVVHLHGERGGRDHLSLAQTDRRRLTEFIGALLAPPSFRGVVTLEVFSFEDTAASIGVLKELL